MCCNDLCLRLTQIHWLVALRLLRDRKTLRKGKCATPAKRLHVIAGITSENGDFARDASLVTSWIHREYSEKWQCDDRVGKDVIESRLVSFAESGPKLKLEHEQIETVLICLKNIGLCDAHGLCVESLWHLWDSDKKTHLRPFDVFC